MSTGTIGSAAGRWQALDALRGLTIAGMILVNNPGVWDKCWPLLKHAQWDGLTLADLVFPFFLFIMGGSLQLASERQLQKGIERLEIFKHGMVRGAKLFLIGLALGLTWDWHLDSFRILGVLQRIGLVYVICLIFYLWVPKSGWWIYTGLMIAGGILLQHLLITPPYLNLYANVDGAILGNHAYSATKPLDPEGILSTLPAVCSGLLGIISVQFMKSGNSRGWISLAIGLLAVAYTLDMSTLLPINKTIWTASFALATAGYATLLLGLASWWEHQGGGGLVWKTLVPTGLNPIGIYVASELGHHIFQRPWFSDYSIKNYYYMGLHPVFEPSGFTSLLWSLTMVAIWLLVAQWMNLRKVYFKV